MLTFSSPFLVSLVHDRQEEILVPVSGRKDDAVIKKLINGICKIIFSDSRVGYLMEVLGDGESEGGGEGGGEGEEGGWGRGKKKWKVGSKKEGGRRE